MPMFKVYLGNLDSKVTVETLKPLFEPFGEVEEIVIATDEAGKSRGFAIILFRDPLKGQLAIETLSNKKINGRTVVINEAIKKGKKTQPANRMPRNSPLGPRAFPRAGGFSRGPGGGRGASGGGPRGAGGGSRFIRNPRRLFNQMPGGEGASGGSPTGGAVGGHASAPRPPAARPPSSPSSPSSSPPSSSSPSVPRPGVTPSAPPKSAAPPGSQSAVPGAATPAPAAPEQPARPRAVRKPAPPAVPPEN